MDNSFQYTCLVFYTFVNINILYVVMQLISTLPKNQADGDK